MVDSKRVAVNRVSGKYNGKFIQEVKQVHVLRICDANVDVENTWKNEYKIQPMITCGQQCLQGNHNPERTSLTISTNASF